MVDFLLSSSGDIDLTNNIMTLTPTTEELVRNRLLITLQTYRGEWNFNIVFGVPYLSNDNNPTQLLGKTEKEVFDSFLQVIIIEVEGVVSLVSYTSTLDEVSRRLSVDFSVSTETGNIVNADNFIINI